MWWDTLALAIREIRRRVLRSFLTVLGVVIGVAAVIIMVTVGRGATARITADISSLGSNLLVVIAGQHRGPGGSSAAPRAFDLRDVAAIADQVASIRAVAPTASRQATVVYGNQNRATSVVGTTDLYLTTRAWGLGTGRNFAEAELRAGKAVCLLGETVRGTLFGRMDPLGQRIRVGKISCQVIGVLAAKGQSSMGNDQDDTLLMPLRTFHRRIAGNQDVGAVMVSAAAQSDTEKARADIQTLLRERRHIAAGNDDDFTVLDMKEIAATLTGTTRVLTMLLGAVAAVSLLVGGIGIMNIMLVSVTERTREIGTRLAIGALESEVLRQFLVEAVVLSSLGGLVGVAVALAATAAITRTMNIPFLFDPGIIALAFAFSGAIGVIFGYVPARRAARLDPIEALRHE
ncbi:MAG: ABC transporter permease [Deltaproteobacteria bacterium]|nr:ABC transporter permease [Deltaproteobacteria bacterium]